MTNNGISNDLIDVDIVKILERNYNFKIDLLAEWFDISLADVQKILGSTNTCKWETDFLAKDERATITEMVNKKIYFKQTLTSKYYLLNNMKNDCVFLIVNSNKVKCIFQKKLPGTLPALIKDGKLNLLTEEEAKVYDDLVEEAIVKKKNYIKPLNSSKFKFFAENRNLSLKDYAKVVYNKPYCDKNFKTDKEIISELENYSTNSVIDIDSIPNNHWIYKYVDKLKFKSLNDLVVFYGYSVDNQLVENSKLPQHDVFDVEEDMKEKNDTSDSNNIHYIFNHYPLLGSYIFKENELKKLYIKSSKILEDKRKDNSYHLSSLDKMCVALAVINYCKEWDSEDETGFWSFITSQFGYLDDTNNIRSILCECVKDGLEENNRWFFGEKNNNAYKSSIVIHSFATKKSWIYFCDFLFNFYKENLNYKYIHNDPLINVMISYLQNKIIDPTEKIDEIKISSNTYQFREGLKKLIIYRPKYFTKLVHVMLKHIDDIYWNNDNSTSCYEEKLCDEWMKQKIEKIYFGRNTNRSENKKNIALDYSRITPSYQLNDEKIFINFPDIRLQKNDISSACVNIYCDDNLIDTKALEFYGNKLGKTIKEFSLNVNDYRSLNIRIEIYLDSDKIFDSKESLYRSYLIFKGDREVLNDNQLKNNENYYIFLSSELDVKFQNIEETEINHYKSIKGFFLEFEKDFCIYINGKPILFDTINSHDNGMIPKIFAANEINDAIYSLNNIRYRILNNTNELKIAFFQNKINKYKILLNDEVVNWNDLLCENVNDSEIYALHLKDNKNNLKILDFSDEKTVVDINYINFNDFDYKFNEIYYFGQKDYQNCKLQLSINGINEEYTFNENEDYVFIPYENGFINIMIPKIVVKDNYDRVWNGLNSYWIKDIKDDTFFNIMQPQNVNVELSVDTIKVSLDESIGKYAIGNKLYSVNSNDTGWIDIKATVSYKDEIKTYLLGKLSTGVGKFLTEPSFAYANNCLKWDCRKEFIGEQNIQCKLELIKENDIKVLDLNLNTSVIDSNVSLELGEYEYTIYTEIRKNIFSPIQKEIISKGTLLIGDKNELRFLNKTIEINKITEDSYHKHPISRVYVDSISYQGMEYDNERNLMPIYNGIMFYVDRKMNRHEFSFAELIDKKGRELYQINPVKIMYINDSILSITNQDGDGLYYIHTYTEYLDEHLYQITDINLDNIKNCNNQQGMNDFNVVDLYEYTVKGDKKNV